MNLSELIEEVRSLLSEPSSTNSRWTDVELTRWLNLAQKKVAEYTLCVKKSITITYPPTNTLPDDLIFIYEVKVDNVKVYPTTTRELNDFANNFETLTGTPRFYYQRTQGTIDLFYKPTSNVSLTVYYFALPNNLVNNTDVPFNDIKQYYAYHDILVNYTVYRAYLKEKNFDIANFYYSLFWDDLRRMKTNIEYENEDKVYAWRDVQTNKSAVDDPNYLWTGLEKK